MQDDGKDFPSRSWSGLANMRQRAERLGGRCVVSSTASGTTVEWSVPLQT